MPDPNALYEDMQKLDALCMKSYCWGHPDDELQFTHDGQRRVIITNKTLEEKQ